jgi:hypothetical protein
MSLSTVPSGSPLIAEVTLKGFVDASVLTTVQANNSSASIDLILVFIYFSLEMLLPTMI